MYILQMKFIHMHVLLGINNPGVFAKEFIKYTHNKQEWLWNFLL